MHYAKVLTRTICLKLCKYCVIELCFDLYLFTSSIQFMILYVQMFRFPWEMKSKNKLIVSAFKSSNQNITSMEHWKQSRWIKINLTQDLHNPSYFLMFSICIFIVIELCLFETLLCYTSDCSLNFLANFNLPQELGFLCSIFFNQKSNAGGA